MRWPRLSGFGIATAYVIPWAMVADVVEVDEAETGQRREGSYYAFASFFQKLATGRLRCGPWAQALAAGRLLTPTATNSDARRSLPSAITAIRLFTGPIPACLLLLAVLFAWQYPDHPREPPRTGRGARRPVTDFETLAVHAGEEADPSTGALRLPLHMATTFKLPPFGGKLFDALTLVLAGRAPRVHPLEQPDGAGRWRNGWPRSKGRRPRS